MKGRGCINEIRYGITKFDIDQNWPNSSSRLTLVENFIYYQVGMTLGRNTVIPKFERGRAEGLKHQKLFVFS